MRLIDAEETLRLMEFEEEKYQYEEHYGYREAEKFIASQPTIDAIPVAFIEERMRKYEELAYNSVTKIQQRYFDKEDALKSLIYYWNKENGKGEENATV